MGSTYVPLPPLKTHRICTNPTGAVRQGWGVWTPGPLASAATVSNHSIKEARQERGRSSHQACTYTLEALNGSQNSIYSRRTCFSCCIKARGRHFEHLFAYLMILFNSERCLDLNFEILQFSPEYVVLSLQVCNI